jgi:ATP-dependent RNA helicase DDX5/DBP2
VANRDVTQLVAMLSDEGDRLPALQDYLHEHLHGAERLGGSGGAGSSSRQLRDAHAAEHPSAPAVTDAAHPRVLVFANTKRVCDDVAHALRAQGVRAGAVHGDKSQVERDNLLRAFRQGRLPVLVATDVAARGLDVPGVTAVVNYNFPTDHENYIHRIGRTGRAGRKGESLSLLTPSDASVTPLLVGIMRDAGQAVPPELEAVAARVRQPAQSRHRYGGGGRGGGYGRGGRAYGRGGRGGGGGGFDRFRGGGGGWADCGSSGGDGSSHGGSNSYGGRCGGGSGGDRNSWGDRRSDRGGGGSSRGSRGDIWG